MKLFPELLPLKTKSVYFCLIFLEVYFKFSNSVSELSNAFLKFLFVGSVLVYRTKSIECKYSYNRCYDGYRT
nr:MAG TPA: hypothetical protein [Caudoviricetes sp.]